MANSDVYYVQLLMAVIAVGLNVRELWAVLQSAKFYRGRGVNGQVIVVMKATRRRVIGHVAFGVLLLLASLPTHKLDRDRGLFFALDVVLVMISLSAARDRRNAEEFAAQRIERREIPE